MVSTLRRSCSARSGPTTRRWWAVAVLGRGARHRRHGQRVPPVHAGRPGPSRAQGDPAGVRLSRSGNSERRFEQERSTPAQRVQGPLHGARHRRRHQRGSSPGWPPRTSEPLARTPSPSTARCRCAAPCCSRSASPRLHVIHGAGIVHRDLSPPTSCSPPPTAPGSSTPVHARAGRRHLAHGHRRPSARQHFMALQAAAGHRHSPPPTSSHSARSPPSPPSADRRSVRVLARGPHRIVHEDP